MKHTEVDHGQVNAAVARLFGAFGDSAFAVISRINQDREFAANIAHYAVHGVARGLKMVRPEQTAPDFDQAITNEFNLNPARIAQSTIDESVEHNVDPRSAFLNLQARLPIVVSDCLQEAGKILENSL